MLYAVAATVLLAAGSDKFVYFDVVGVKVAKTPFCLTAVVLVN